MATLFYHRDAHAPQPSSPTSLHHDAGLTQQLSRVQSRFVEGSMNDRVSNAPPPSFMGAEELAAYERQFYTVPERPILIDLGSGSSPDKEKEKIVSPRHIMSMPPPPRPPPAPSSEATRRPMSSAGHPTPQPQPQPKKSGFFAPLWDNVRHLLPRSRSSIGLGAGVDGNKENRAPAAIQQVPETLQEHEKEKTEDAEVYKPKIDLSLYPTREEALESYKNLMAAGFFSAHAIQSTRYALPDSGTVNSASAAPAPAPPAPLQSVDGNAVPRAPTYAPPPPPVRSFAQHKAAAAAAGAEKHEVPHQNYQPPAPPFAVTPLVPRLSIEARPSTEGFDTGLYHRMSGSSIRPVTASPGRGTKRTAKSAALGIEPDHETEGRNPGGGNSGSSNGNGARKLVKRLRKSTSRISTEIARPIASAATSKTSFTLSRPSTTASAAPNFTSASASLSSSLLPHSIFAGHSHGRDVASHRISEDGTDAASELQKTPSKLTKMRYDAPQTTKTSSWRGRRRDAAHSQSQSQSQSQNQARSRLPWTSAGAGDAMMVDQPGTRASREKDKNSYRCIRRTEDTSSHEDQAQEQYRLRTRHSAGEAAVPEPVSVVPDVVRGIPSVPQIPAQFNGRFGPVRRALGASLKGRAQRQVDGGDQQRYGNRDSGLGEDVDDACDESW